MIDASYRLVPLGALELPGPFFDRTSVRGLACSLRMLGPLEPILVSPLRGGAYEVIAGRRRVLAARQAGFDALPARVLSGVDGGLVRLAENVARRELGPAPLAEAVSALAASRGPTRVAEAIGLGVAHVENLLRLRGALDEEAWRVFQNEGPGGNIRDWFALGSLSKDEQRRELASSRGGARPPAMRPGAGRVRPARELEAALRRLPAADVRAQTLRWVLDAGPFPEGRSGRPVAPL